MGTTPFRQGNGNNPAPDAHSRPHTLFWRRSVSYVVSYYPEQLKVKNDEVRYRDEIWPGMVGLTHGQIRVVHFQVIESAKMLQIPSKM